MILFQGLDLRDAAVHVVVVADRDALENTIGPWSHQDCVLEALCPHLLESITNGWNLYSVGQRSLRVSGIVFDPTRSFMDVVNALARYIVGGDEVCLIVGLETSPPLRTGAMRVLDGIVHDPRHRFEAHVEYGRNPMAAYQKQFRMALIVNGGNLPEGYEVVTGAEFAVGFPHMIESEQLFCMLGM